MTHPLDPPPPPSDPIDDGRSPWLMGVGGLLALALLLFVIFLVLVDADEEDQPPAEQSISLRA